MISWISRAAKAHYCSFLTFTLLTPLTPILLAAHLERSMPRPLTWVAIGDSNNCFLAGLLVLHFCFAAEWESLAGSSHSCWFVCFSRGSFLACEFVRIDRCFGRCLILRRGCMRTGANQRSCRDSRQHTNELNHRHTLPLNRPHKAGTAWMSDWFHSGTVKWRFLCGYGCSIDAGSTGSTDVRERTTSASRQVRSRFCTSQSILLLPASVVPDRTLSMRMYD